MLFRRGRRAPSRKARWQQLAEDLNLAVRPDGEAVLTDCLDLSVNPLASEVFQASETGALRLFAFDFHSAADSAGGSELMTGCLLLSEARLSPLALRFDRQLRSQLARIRAGASQARLVLTGAADGFDDRVSTVARDEEAARQLLNAPVRSAVDRLLGRDGPAPVLSVSGNQLFAQLRAADPELEQEVSYLLTDLLGLYAALSALKLIPDRAS